MESYLLLLGAQGCVCITCQHSAHVRVNECVRLTRPPTFVPICGKKKSPQSRGRGGWVLVGAAGCAGASCPRVPLPCPTSRTVGSSSVVSARTSNCVL